MPNKLSALDDADPDANTLTGLPQAEHDRRTEDLTNLRFGVGLGWPKDREWTPQYLLLMLRAGRFLTPAQHDRAIDYIVSHYQFYPNPAQYHAAGLGVPVASLADEGADGGVTEEAELWDWYRKWAERLYEGYRFSVTLENGSTHRGAGRQGLKEWILDDLPRHYDIESSYRFVRVQVEMPPKIPLLMEEIFSQIEPTIGKAIHRMVEYLTVGNEFLRGQFKKAALLRIDRRAQRASEKLTPIQSARLQIAAHAGGAVSPQQIADYLNEHGEAHPRGCEWSPSLVSRLLTPDVALLRTEDISDDAVRVFQGVLELRHPMAYYTIEMLQGKLDEQGNRVFSDQDVANQIQFIEHKNEILGYVPYLLDEKMRLNRKQQKEEEQAELQRREKEKQDERYRREGVIFEMQNEHERERERDRHPGQENADERYSRKKYERERREGPGG